MANAVTDTQGVLPQAPPTTEELIDEVLVGLPAPPRTRRRLLAVLLTGVSLAALFLAFQLREDVLYALARPSATSLGDGRTADPAMAGANRFVTVHVTPSMAGAVVYSRPLYPGEYLVFPVAGRDAASPLYVQVAQDAAAQALAQGDFSGRLIRFDAAGGRYARVGRYLHDALGAPVRGTTWLLVDDTPPRSLLWAPILVSLLVALALSDLLLLGRLLRPAKP
jgi:hypothetical protein